MMKFAGILRPPQTYTEAYTRPTHAPPPHPPAHLLERVDVLPNSNSPAHGVVHRPGYAQFSHEVEVRLLQLLLPLWLLL